MRFFILIAVFLNLASCWRCPDKNLLFVPLAPQAEEYFGVYKPANWWVYFNQDRSKTDSIYLADYLEDTVRDRATCTESVQRKFKIKNYNLGGADIIVDYEAFETGTSFRLSSPNLLLPGFTYDKSKNKFFIYHSSDPTGNHLLDSIKLNGIVYNDILFGKAYGITLYFSRNTGLAGWTTVNDTFNLVRYRIF